ncbi:hypothetical protein HY416_01430 [Candidatus Kaiserbacteria bacterium]|nr:hypothetical protein [Candidatus Kaiserbacteria bacterium]
MTNASTTGNVGTGTGKYREILAQFDEHSIPDLDIAVLGALELFETAALPPFPIPRLAGKRLLVVGSGNAAVVGRLLFDDVDARYADESTYEHELATHRERIDSAVIVSASGGKDADGIAAALKKEGIPLWLLTANERAPARAHVDPEQVLVFPKNREPYTYNTSTYMGMLLAKTQEDPNAILGFITDTVAQAIPDTLAKYDAFYCILPAHCIGMKDMLLTKFDELFGARVSARAFTLEETMHAKTDVPSETECFISFGEENTMFGDPSARVHIPLPSPPTGGGYAAMMAIAYYTIGQIQKQHPPYFKDNIGRYAEEASKLFGERISVIVA